MSLKIFRYQMTQLQNRNMNDYPDPVPLWFEAGVFPLRPQNKKEYPHIKNEAMYILIDDQWRSNNNIIGLRNLTWKCGPVNIAIRLDLKYARPYEIWDHNNFRRDYFNQYTLMNLLMEMTL